MVQSRSGEGRRLRRQQSQRDRKLSQNSHVVAIATKKDQACRFEFACRHGRRCWGKHTLEENEWFRQREAVEGKEAAQRCVYCAADVCKYGVLCVGQTAMHPAGASREATLSRAEEVAHALQPCLDKAVSQNCSRRRPHRKRRCRASRRKRRARAYVHEQAAAQATGKADVRLPHAMAQEVAGILEVARQQVAQQMEENTKATRLMCQEHLDALEHRSVACAPEVRAVSTQAEETEEGLADALIRFGVHPSDCREVITLAEELADLEDEREQAAIHGGIAECECAKCGSVLRFAVPKKRTAIQCYSCDHKNIVDVQPAPAVETSPVSSNPSAPSSLFQFGSAGASPGFSFEMPTGSSDTDY